MFCPKCGRRLIDNAKFCNGCGAPAPVGRRPTNQTAVAAAKTPALVAQAPQQPTQHVDYISKNKFIATAASSKTKLMAKISWGVAVLCIAILAIGLFVSFNSRFYNIPLVKVIATSMDYDRELRQISTNAKEWLEYAEEVYQVKRETMDPDFRDAAEDMLDDANDLVRTDNLSILSVKEYADNYENEVYMLDDYLEVDQLDLVIDVLDYVIIVIAIFFILAMLLTLLAAIFSKTGLAIAAAVTSCVICYLFAGIWCLIPAIITFGGLTVLHILIGREHKAYLSGNTIG